MPEGGMTEPVVVPRFHSWSVSCDDTGLPLDQQITDLLARLRPHARRIAELAKRLSAEDPLSGASLQIVRYFNKAVEDNTNSADGSGGEAPTGFGWFLERDVVAFLASTGASLGVDEYDMTEE